MVIAVLAALIVAAFFAQKALSVTYEVSTDVTAWQCPAGDCVWGEPDALASDTVDWQSDPYPDGQYDSAELDTEQVAVDADLKQSGNFHCKTASVIVSHHNAVGWDIYKAKWSQRFCYNGTKVANVRNLQDSCWMTGLGEALNWSCDESAGGDADGHYLNNQRSHVSWSRVHFHECTPIPTGCIGIANVYWKGNMKVFRGGGIIFKKHNG